VKVAVIDCLGRGSKGKRLATLDAIGVGPRLVVGIIESLGDRADLLMCEDILEGKTSVRDYDAVFISGMSTDKESITNVARKCSGRPVIVGGPVFVEYEYLIRNGVDYVIWGEGELSIPQLMKFLRGGIDVSEVPNLIYRGRRGVIRNPGPPYADSPPLWYFKPSVKAVMNYPLWRVARVYVEVVRGCSNFYRPTIPLANGKRCTQCNLCRDGPLEARFKCPLGIPPGCGYCSVPSLFGPARSRPLDQIVNEVKELVRLGVKRVVLSAPDFLDYGRDWLVKPKPLTDPRNPPPNVEALESLLGKLTSIDEISRGEAYIMIENIKPNLVNEEVANILGKYLKDTPVSIGLETGDEEFHVALGRPSTVPEVINAVRLLTKVGLRPYIYLIHGLPCENKKVIKNTINVIKELAKLGVEKFTLYRFTPLRHTAFEGYPQPPPAIKSKTSKKLYFTVRKLNEEFKKRFLGKILKALVAGTEDDNLILYPLPHGPVVKVKYSGRMKFRIGDLVKVKITNILSDREVGGFIIE